jgi:hypothetical protein
MFGSNVVDVYCITTQIPTSSIFQHLVNQDFAYNNRKFVQFVVIRYLLTHGRPMTDFENMRSFLVLLKVKHCPKKHWCDSVG